MGKCGDFLKFWKGKIDNLNFLHHIISNLRIGRALDNDEVMKEGFWDYFFDDKVF